MIDNIGGAYKAIIGRKVVELLDVSGDYVNLKLNDGQEVQFWLEGGCCSNSYFTNPEDQFGELLETVIQDVEERNESPDAGDYPDRDGYSHVSWHFLVFTTNKGHVTIDWRNDSNGYYDGWIQMKVVK